MIGLDFSTGNFSHSIRFEYLKFQNQIVDATRGSSLPLAIVPLGNTDGRFDSPDQTTLLRRARCKAIIRSSTTAASHWVRMSSATVSVTTTLWAGALRTSSALHRTCSRTWEISKRHLRKPGPSLAATSNPLNYPVESVVLGNGLGYSTTTPAFGYPAGGNTDNRIGAYVGDSWKVKRNLTLTYGLRYVRDTGRIDSNLPGIPQLNALMPGLGNPVKQPNLNFAPQLGIAWDPTGQGKTVIRAGIGLFYENAIWNNVAFDAPDRQRTGAFGHFPTACDAANHPQPVLASGGATSSANLLRHSIGGLVAIGTVANQIEATRGCTSRSHRLT